MNPLPIGVGIFILREQAQKDLFGVLEQLRDIGYDGAELLGFFGKTPSALRAKLDELKFRAIGNHVPYEAFIQNPDQVIGDHLEIGCGFITIAHGENQFTPGTQAYTDMLSGMGTLIEKCRKAGLTPLYHNHGWDVKGSPAYLDGLLDNLSDAGLCLEPDLGWMVAAGADPKVYLQRYAALCPVLHWKDVYADDFSKVPAVPGDSYREADRGGFEFRPTGYGSVNFPALMPLCRACQPDWVMVDHDLAYHRNPFEDLRLSYAYTKALWELG